MWPDTDPAGIVWFGVFFRYFEQAEEELFRRLGRDRTALLADLGIFMPRTSLQSRFKSPAKLGDEQPEVQEAVIGVTFVLGATGSVLLLASNVHGSEHLRDLLVGQILWAQPSR